MKIVTLCGSTKFKKEFLKALEQEERKGNIVLSVGFFTHADNIPLSLEHKKELDKLHLAKIDMSDEILVIDVDGYIGESTYNEIRYASRMSIKIRYWNDEEEE